MTDDPSRGRRGNGLGAQEWGALVDVDPRLSAQLLERLAAAGVAAHVEPAGSTTDPVSRAGTLPARPLDRLWVDVARADDARAVVEAQAEEVVATLPEAGGVEQFLHAVPRGASGRVLKPPPRLTQRSASPDVDTDAAWREIVAGFGRSTDSPVAPWPVQEDVQDDLPRRPAPDRPARRRRTDPPAEAGLPGWVEPEPIADEGHYVPPPPPPPPRVSPRTLGAVAAIVLGVLMLVAPTVLGTASGPETYLLGMLLAGGGVAVLLLGMRDGPRIDDGPDDGAVV